MNRARNVGSAAAAGLISLGFGLSLGCSSPEPEVDVNTYVGKSYAQADPELAQRAASKVFDAVSDEFTQQLSSDLWKSGAATPNAAGLDVAHPATSTRELEALIKAVRSGPLDEIAGPARRLAATPPKLWPEIRTRLLAERKAPKGDYRSLLSAIGGDVPNKYGTFALAWKKAHGHNVKLSNDWFEDLLTLPRSKVSAGLLPVYRDCVLQTAMLRATQAAGQDPARATEVVDTLLDVAYLHRGTFRDEVSRAVVAVGDEAIPQLIVASLSPSSRKRDQDKPEVRRAKFAELMLDKMDRLHPARATEAVRQSPRLLAAVLDAYGVRRPGGAAEVLLAHADDRSPEVRAAARRGFRTYVDGPAPKSAGKTLRLLGGGTGRALAYLNYRDRARISLEETLAASAPALQEEACEVTDDKGRVDEACEGQPARHATAYFAWLDTQRSASQRAQVDAALANTSTEDAAEALDRLLAQGELSQPVRVARFFAAHAETVAEAGESARAAALYRKASMLLRGHDDDAAKALHARALQAEASFEGLPRTGRLMLLDRALTLRPDADVQAARDEAAAAPAFTVPEQANGTRLFAGVGLLSAVLLACGLLGAPLRRRLFREERR